MTTRETVASPAVEARPQEAPAGFAALGLAPQILDVLQQLEFVTPTPIQHSAIPLAMKGEDIIGIAQTGTGKTLAFGLPMLHRFVSNGNRSRGRGLIVLPTRELALQVDEALQKVGKPFGLRTTVLIGGAPMRPQLSSLRNNPDIIVATPGRLIDHLQSRSVDLRSVDVLVLDEADRMLDMGFAPQIKQILREVPDERQTMLFSATMPDQIVHIAENYMTQPARVEIGRSGNVADDVTQELFVVPQDEKDEVLARLLYDYTGSVLVFARTRIRAQRVARFIKHAGHSAAEIHADRTLIQRRAALDGFKTGRYRILVATDIAARGIDVSDIELVINYDLPDCAEDYVHRIGRTGRAGKSGHAISLAAPDQGADLREIEKLIRGSVAVSDNSTHEFNSGGRSRSRRSPGNSRGGSNGGNRAASTERREAASPEAQSAPQGPTYSNEGYARPRSLRRSPRSFSGRNNPRSS